VLIDAATLAQQSHELGQRICSWSSRGLRDRRPALQPGSPKQIGEILFGKLGLPVVKKTATGAPSTDEEVLEKLAEDYPLPAKHPRAPQPGQAQGHLHRQAAADGQPGTGRVHTNYAQAVAVTGRLSSNDPNLQNIPIRTAEGRACARPSWRRRACHRQRRLLADRAAHHGPHQRRPAPAAGLRRRLDVHRATAAEVFGVALAEVTSEQRRYAKVINFGLIYGMSAFGLAQQPGHRPKRRRLHRPLLRSATPACAATWTRPAAAGQGARAMWRPCSAAACTCPRSTAQRPAPRGRRARRHQRADAGHGGRPDQAGHDRGAAGAGREGGARRMIMQVHDELVFEVPDASWTGCAPRSRA
jgi:DNA polymerase-1